ncbi:MAG: VCBS repeat-containing protein [Bacteroidetes bacterium]|nr:VCBS repeat-containing protein [Bacteroidota bacterium]MBS1541820.1 VCBS repeat-containing protein [Bacteroidota bacterium]
MENSGIDFTNTLTESNEANVFKYRNFYNGGGVAIGDLNNDGLADVFFTGNQVPNRLYLNLGGMKFRDISASAGFGEKKQWSTGVTLVDINHDGWLDIYVCNAGNMTDSLLRRNQLFINRHNLTFSEEAEKYGLAETGYTTQATFFDYDLDGDLDCFLVDNSPIPVNSLNYANKRDLPAKQWNVPFFLKGGGDHLYRNDNGKFKEVTKEAGIHGSLISLGLGVIVGDVNQDGYPDIFVSNDFFERDYLYINQKDGTFQDELENWVQHISLASMGADIQDINNDGYPDLFTTDMLPDNDYRLKTTASFDNYDTYHLKETSGFYHQFMKNTLQLNNRNGKFMEIANYSNVHASDWSWGALFLDADNDGYNDLYICNGIRYDLTDQDFINFFSSTIVQQLAVAGRKEDMNEIISKMSSQPQKKKAFKNNGDLTFTDTGDAWGLTQTSFSNGAAYGDLDNDGDLDLIVNNVNQTAFVYQNNNRELTGNSYVGFSLKGKDLNRFALGSKVSVYFDGQVASREMIPSRGFQSSMDYKIFIGVGHRAAVDSAVIIWPDLTKTKLISPTLNKVHEVSQPVNQPAALHLLSKQNKNEPPLFSEIASDFKKHEEDEFVDFYQQRNIPRMLSKEGPRAAQGDVNGDGLDDLFICSTPGHPGTLYLQTTSGKFVASNQKAWKDNTQEQVAALFFDCDGDGDLDLYVGSGGNNAPPRSPQLAHQLFKNDGKGNFSLLPGAFTENSSNVGTVQAFDFDGDNDLDLFIGGRSAPYLYGVVPDSYFYMNDGSGHFTEWKQKGKGNFKPGMITGSVRADIIGDKTQELIVVGEWMSPKVLQVTKDGITEIKTSLDNLHGWYQSVSASDLDGDGKVDLILGNIGENFYLRPDSLKPVKLWINYFGVDGSIQQFMTQTVAGRDVPVFMKRSMEEQFSYLKKKSLKYTSYASKSAEELFDKKLLQDAEKKYFNFCPSVIAWNEGNGQFKIQQLPVEVQFSSVNAIQCADVNHDGKPDIITGGNIYDFTPQLERLDSNFGSVMINQGNRTFQLLSTREAGIQISGQVRDIKYITQKNKTQLLFLRNNDFPVMFQNNIAKQATTQ